MAKSVHDFWNHLSSKYTNKGHGIYHVRELHLVPKVPGIYSWQISATPNHVDDYYKVFHQKRVNVVVKGSLKEKYSGRAKRIADTRDFDTSTIDTDLFEYASHIFCPPLYIGISKNLNERLGQHFEELERVHTGMSPLSLPKLGLTDFDTIVESSHFAERIGHTLRTMNNITLDSLTIKTLELDKSYTKAQLLNIEKYLNRIYNPIFGRK